jgi:hypothetical protein
MRSRFRQSAVRTCDRRISLQSSRSSRVTLGTLTDRSDGSDQLASFKTGALRQLRWLRALSSRAKSTKPGSFVQSTVHEIGSALQPRSNIGLKLTRPRQV